MRARADSREPFIRAVEVVAGERNLLEVVLVAHASGGFANLLHSGQKQAHEYRNDCDDNE